MYVYAGSFGVGIADGLFTRPELIMPRTYYVTCGRQVDDVTVHDLTDLGALGDVVGSTSQGDRIWRLTVPVEVLLERGAANRAAREAKIAERDARYEKAVAAALASRGEEFEPIW